MIPAANFHHVQGTSFRPELFFRMIWPTRSESVLLAAEMMREHQLSVDSMGYLSLYSRNLLSRFSRTTPRLSELAIGPPPRVLFHSIWPTEFPAIAPVGSAYLPTSQTVMLPPFAMRGAICCLWKDSSESIMYQSERLPEQFSDSVAGVAALTFQATIHICV